MGCFGSNGVKQPTNLKYGHFRMGLNDNMWINEEGLKFGD